MAEKLQKNDNWLQELQVTSKEGTGIVLATKDTYVDRDIEVQVAVDEGTLAVAADKAAQVVTATVSTTDTTYTTTEETPYAITIAADASAEARTITVEVNENGFVDATDNTSVTIAAGNATKDTKTRYIRKGELAGSTTSKIVTGGENGVKLTEVAAVPTDGSFYVQAKATGTVGVETAGWVDPEENPAIDASSEKVYTVKAVTLANTAGDEAYVEAEAPVLTEGGYLYINEGYIGPTKISLKTLVPDNANITSENANMVYNTVKAYDKDGALIVGTMGDATLGAITANDATATVKTIAVTADGNKFKVAGTADIAGSTSVQIANRGLAETSLKQSGVISGTATVDAELNKVALAIDTPEAITVTPVIAKEESTAKSGTISTSAPEGVHYVAVSTAAITATSTVTPKVATEGYGTTTVFDATGATVTGGATASGTYYVGITNGAIEATVGAATPTNATMHSTTAIDVTDNSFSTAGVVESAPEGNYIIITTTGAVDTKGAVTGDVTITATEGYITAASAPATKTVSSNNVGVTITNAPAKYIRIYEGEVRE